MDERPRTTELTKLVLPQAPSPTMTYQVDPVISYHRKVELYA
jgi:hypothetical protein